MKSFITIITSVVCSFAAVIAAPQGQTEQNPRRSKPTTGIHQ
jgi:hypothetical protein